MLAESLLDAERRSAQTLAPAIVDVLKAAAVEAEQVRLVATTVGPGSFTGLRVGVTTAKTFAYAVGAGVMGVSTLEAIAQQAPAELVSEGSGEVQAVLDAQRRELFVGLFQRHGTPQRALPTSDSLLALQRVEADRLVAADAWVAGLEAGTVVTGGGLQKFAGRFAADVLAVEPAFWQPRAATVGRLAWRDYGAGRRDDLWSLKPVYLRPSYAEEKAAKKT